MPEPNPNPEPDPTPSGDPEPTSFSWRGQIGDLAEDKTLSTFPDDVDGLSNLAKSYVHAQQRIGHLTGGKEVIFKPGERASEQEIAEYRKAMGIPTEVDGYEFTAPELPEGIPYDGALDKEFGAWAHELGLTREQAQGLRGKFIEKTGKNWQLGVDNAVSSRREAEDKLRGEWGMAFDQNIQLARSVMLTFGDQDTVKFAEESGLADHPGFIRFLHKIGTSMKEDTLQGVRKQEGVSTPAEADRNIAELQADKAFWDKTHPQHTAKVAEYEKLLRQSIGAG